MRRMLLTACLAACAAWATAQDFASKYMEENGNDTLLSCVSISPKMINEVLKGSLSGDKQEEIRDILTRVKSIRIVHAEKNGADYYERAERMAKGNAGRFEPYLAFNEKAEKCYLMMRKKKERIVELVLFSHENEAFQVVNLTGDMDEAFLTKLVRTMLPGERQTE